MDIINIFIYNYKQEIKRLHAALQTHHNVAIDTEFPGFIKNTPRDACESRRYADLHYNVSNSSLVQVGLTLADDKGQIGGTWQFNLWVRSRTKGIPIPVFATGFRKILIDFYGKIKWITFHGLYDIAYLLTAVPCRLLPNSVVGFMSLAGRCFGRIYDLKAMAMVFGDTNYLGLEKLAKILGVKRVRRAHQAGSDSLVTAGVFLKLASVYGLDEDVFEGNLYGVSIPASCVRHCHQQPPMAKTVVCLGRRHHDRVYYCPEHHHGCGSGSGVEASRRFLMSTIPVHRLSWRRNSFYFVQLGLQHRYQLKLLSQLKLENWTNADIEEHRR